MFMRKTLGSSSSMTKVLENHVPKIRTTVRAGGVPACRDTHFEIRILEREE